jgi:ABC-type polysaccharide/polyol phosphate transport system ATPase subunit
MAIRLENVSKSFVRSWRSRRPLYRELVNFRPSRRGVLDKNVLREVCLDIPDGSRVAVIGANGAGKSTLLRLIAGIYTPTSGELSVDGRVCCFLEPGAGVAPALPVRDNVFLYASLAGLGYRETHRSLPRILEFCSLGDQEYTWVEHLSFGMQQRLFMSIQLEVMRLDRLFMSIQLEVMRLDRATVFLFDEFLMGVDKSFRRRVEHALTEFPNRRQVVLHASHDHELMLRTCETAIYVGSGGIESYGPIAAVLERYRSVSTE